MALQGDKRHLEILLRQQVFVCLMPAQISVEFLICGVDPDTPLLRIRRTHYIDRIEWGHSKLSCVSLVYMQVF